MDTEQVVRAIYGGWNEDGFDSVARQLQPRVIWRPSGVLPGLDPVYHGHRGVRRFWDGMKSSWHNFGVSIERAAVRGELALFSVTFEGVDRQAGSPVQLSFSHVWQFEDGLVARCRAFRSEEEALIRAGELG